MRWCFLLCFSLLEPLLGCRTFSQKNSSADPVRNDKVLNEGELPDGPPYEGNNIWVDDIVPSEQKISKLNSACREDGIGPMTVLPFKKTPRGLWDQGDSAACKFFALVNANILAGADDTNGKFKTCMDDCMTSKGFPGFSNGTGPGYTTSGGVITGTVTAASIALIECKVDCKNKDDKAKHDFTLDDLPNGWILGEDVESDGPCKKVKDTLAAGDAVMVGVTVSAANGGGGHALSAKAVRCSPPEPNPSKITFVDPNDPEFDFECDVDAAGNISNCKAKDPATGRDVPATPPPPGSPPGTQPTPPPTTFANGSKISIVVVEKKATPPPR